MSAGGAASEWSDGFRTVRSLKYGGSSDGYSELYRKLVVVGGLSDKQELWPAELKQYMQVGKQYMWVGGQYMCLWVGLGCWAVRS